MRHAMLPASLESIWLNNCGTIRDFGYLKLPPGLVHINIMRNNIGWIGRKFVIPTTVKHFYACGNPCMDLRCIVGREFRSIDTRPIEEEGDYWTHKYDHEDSLYTVFASGVLPWDLIAYVGEFLF